MTSTQVIIACLVAAWIVVAVVVALLVGRMVRARDRQKPGSERQLDPDVSSARVADPSTRAHGAD